MSCYNNGDSSVYWQCKNVNTGNTATGLFTSAILPVNTLMLNPQLHINNGLTGGISNLDIAKLYLELPG